MPTLDAHPTPLQQATRLKNDRIRRLRGLYAQAFGLLDSDYMLLCRSLIDGQLRKLGAQSETERRVEDRTAALTGHYYKGYGKRRKLVPFSEAK